MISGLTLILALLMIPHLIIYTNVCISYIANWCGTPEVAAWTLLWVHWLILYAFYRKHRSAQRISDTAQLQTGNARVIGIIGLFALIAGMVALIAEPIILRVLMK